MAVVGAVLDREDRDRDHRVVTRSGAHAYGFPSVDRDVDLESVHALPTQSLVGLTAPELTHDFLGLVDGLEVDYTSKKVGGSAGRQPRGQRELY